MSDVSSDKPNKFPDRWPGVAWGPLAALAVGIPAFLVAQILAGLLLGVIAGLGGASEPWFSTPAAQFYFVLMSDIFVVLAVWYFLRKRRAGPKQIGFSRKPLLRDLGFASVAYVVYFLIFVALSIVASMLTPIDLEQRQELGFDNLTELLPRLMAFVSLVLLPPIVEEIVFRGFIFTGMRKKLKFFWAALVTSAVFAALHLWGSSQGLLWVAALDTLVLSFALCYLREKTGALWAPMMLHGFKNLVAFMILISSVATH